MMRRTALLVAVPLASIAACSVGGDGHPSPRTCSTNEDCGAAWCIQQVCVADTAPTVRLDVPADLRSNRPLTFAAAVADPDPGDAITSARWTVTPVSGGCDADLDETSSAHLVAVFWCPGTYRLELVVRDARGGEGRAEATFVVAPSPSAPTVTAPAEVTLAHRCAGDPLTCEVVPSGAMIQLGAAAADPDGGPLAYDWRALAPPAATAATAVFDPSAATASPAVRVTSPGTAIAGDWRFRVRVTDAEGLLGQAYQVVHVANGSPQVSPARVDAPHRYAASRYVSEATLSATSSDPDGDPVTLAFAYEEPPATGCAAGIVSGAGGPTLQLSCADPAAIAAGIERTVAVTATDVNGATSAAAIAVTVKNEPPTIGLVAGALDPLVLPHAVAACPTGTCYVMSGTSPFVASDPDGDPITPVAFEAVVEPWATASWTTTSMNVNGTPEFQFGAPLASSGQFGSAAFSVVGRASDPWTTATRTVGVLSGNRSPIVKSVPGYTLVGHTYDAVARSYVAWVPAATFEDPDGDPLMPLPSTAPCAAKPTDPWRVECRSAFDWQAAGGLPLGTFVGQHTAEIRAQDPFGGGAFAAQTLSIGDSAPVITCRPTVDLCACHCNKWDPLTGDCLGGIWAFVIGPAGLASVADPDGDPIDVIVTNSMTTWTSRALAQYTFEPSLSLGTYTVSVTATDGPMTASATCTSMVGCSTMGQRCTSY